MKCYYCNNKATNIAIHEDKVEGITYDYPHCEDHRDLDDHTQEALDLWIKHREELQNEPQE